MLRMRKLISLLVIAALLMSCVGASAATLKLPTSVQVIGEGAFARVGAATKVVLPEGIKEIHSLAFVDSGVREINLPSSLTYIADDAFLGAPLTKIDVKKNTYAYDWAVRLGYVSDYDPMDLSISASAAATQVGGKVTWTAKVSGGRGSYQYTYQLYRDGELVLQTDPGTKKTFACTLDTVGSYFVICTVVDDVTEVAVASDVVLCTAAKLSASIACDNKTASVGSTLGWTVSAAGGTGSYTYDYTLYRSTKMLDAVTSESDNYTFTVESTGTYYLVCTVSDGQSTVKVTSDKIKATKDAAVTSDLAIVGLDVTSDSFMTTQTQTWNVSATGGKTPYKYSFELTRGKTTVQSQAYSSDRSFSYTFFQAGSYVLTVSVKDGAKAVVTETYPFDVTLGGKSLTGVVRIYVDTDSRGNIVRSSSKTGHFELEIDNDSGDGLISFDNKVFENPVFSYGSTGDGAVKVFDSYYTDRTNAQLYTFSFTTTADKVDELLNNQMASKYLNINSESSINIGYIYDAKKTYNIKSSNCFTTLAAWCSLLGYGTLSSIVSKSSSYTDYIAWKMFDKYGDEWTYVGDF